MLKPNPNLLADNAAAGYSPPIAYFQMTDPDTAHINSGTGGNMALNGTIALSERGPNQDNCVASKFDGSGDNLSDTTLTISDSKVFTLAFRFKAGSTIANNDHIFHIGAYNGEYFSMQYESSTESLRLWAFNNSIVLALDVNIPIVIGRLYNFAISFDMSNQSVSRVFDGDAEISYSVTTFDDALLNLDAVAEAHVCIFGTQYTDCVLGELYFDTTYTDLSTNNPFWDSDTNKPIPVRQVIEDTEVTPLIALPIRGDKPGQNYGSSGDFTEYSAPFVGARGASEFWARSIKGNGTDGYLLNSTGLGLTSGSKTFSFVCAHYESLADTETLLSIQDASEGANTFKISVTANTINNLDIIGSNSSDTIILNAGQVDALPHDQWNLIMVCCDLASSTLHVYVNGTDVTEATPTLTNDTLDIDNKDYCYVGAEENSGTVRQWFNDNIGFIYFTTDYIDFSDESNRLLFVDGLGYPIDIQKKIDNNEVSTPLIYMPFDDPDDLGNNNGTGGNFTVNGTITQGSDVDPNL